MGLGRGDRRAGSGGDSGQLSTWRRRWGRAGILASETPTLTQTSVPTQTQIPTKTLTPTATSTQTRTPTQTQTPTATLGVGSTRVSEADGMVQVYVPAGAFEMGSEDGYEICRKYRSDCQQSWFEDEEPVHTVYLDAYWINQTEVTNGMFALCVADGACEKPGGSYYSDIAYADHPVVYVSWNDAATYCYGQGENCLPKRSGRRLPGGQMDEFIPGGMNHQAAVWQIILAVMEQR